MNVICICLEDLKIRRDVIDNFIQQYEQEKEKLKKMGCEGPIELKGNNIAKESVQATTKLNYYDALQRIWKIEYHLELLHNEKKTINNRINEIEEKLKNLDGIEEQIYYYRQVKGLSQIETAEKLGITTRHLRRKEKELLYIEH